MPHGIKSNIIIYKQFVSDQFSDYENTKKKVEEKFSRQYLNYTQMKWGKYNQNFENAEIHKI